MKHDAHSAHVVVCVCGVCMCASVRPPRKYAHDRVPLTVTLAESSLHSSTSPAQPVSHLLPVRVERRGSVHDPGTACTDQFMHKLQAHAAGLHTMAHGIRRHNSKRTRHSPHLTLCRTADPAAGIRWHQVFIAALPAARVVMQEHGRHVCAQASQVPRAQPASLTTYR
jgi:hypothetical protein